MKKVYHLILALCLLMPGLVVHGALPSKVLAPYVDVTGYPTFSLISCYNATGQKYYTLAFIVADGSGQPAWGGVTPMSANFMADQISQIRAVGGDVIVSFGGEAGTPIAATITDVNSLVSAYQSIINQYGLTWLDFDIEGYYETDAASISRRDQAIHQLQLNNPGLRVSFTLPVTPSGLDSNGMNVVNNALSAGVNLYCVNIMAMDYGGSNGAMGTTAINAAQGTRSQTGLNIGVTPMIGQNDSQGEIFSLSDASQLLSFAQSNSYVNELAFWSANRDNGNCAGSTSASDNCSGVSESNFGFISVFEAFSSSNGGTGSGPPLGSWITLQGNNGLFVSTNNGTSPMTCDRTVAQGWEKFLVVDAGNGLIELEGENNMFVSSENGASTGMNCNRTVPQGWEQFTWVSQGSGQVSLKGNNGLYVSSNNGSGPLTCDRTVAQGWEIFNWAVSTKSATLSQDHQSATGQVNVYPTLVTTDLNVDNEENGNVHFYIFNSLGQRMQDRNISKGLHDISVASLQNGIYIVKIVSGASIQTVKIVKQ